KARIAVREWVGNRRKRLVEMRSEHVPVGDVVWHPAQAVHVVGKTDEPRRAAPLGQHLEGMAHHTGAHYFAEGADMGQAGGAISGLKQDGPARFRPRRPIDDAPRLLEGPGACIFGGGCNGLRHGCDSSADPSYWPHLIASIRASPSRPFPAPAPDSIRA